jgi:serine/threonine protein kinase
MRLKLGPYELRSLVGAGGMGEVYKAWDSRLRRDVAIKILPRSFATEPDRLRRFEIEAHAAAALNHPNVMAIYDVGAEDGTPYLVCELLQGESLRARLKSGPMPLSEVAGFARQIALGLEAAHAAGITHRDIKPENLFVTREDRIKILDFGLAKVVREERESVPAGASTATGSLTGEGAVTGTAAYMSPEQARGDAVDFRSDIFSLGSVMFEMITGQAAFGGAGAIEIMYSVLRHEPLLDDVAPEWARIVRHCLEKDPARRDTAGALHPRRQRRALQRAVGRRAGRGLQCAFRQSRLARAGLSGRLPGGVISIGRCGADRARPPHG